MSKTIFVTGGGGLIGRALTRFLLKEGHRVICFDLSEQFIRHADFFRELKKTGNLTIAAGTILDRVAVERAMRGADVVVHLAAMLGVARTEENRLACLEVNIRGTEVVLLASVFSRVEHMILASSSEVYGESNQCPIKETDELKGKTVYAVSKLAAENLVTGYHQLYPEFDYTIVRLFNTYGEGQVAQFVLSRFVQAVLDGRNPVIYGDGNQRRGYAHVDDIVHGIHEIICRSVARGKIYNLGNSRDVLSLIELAQKVIDELAPDGGRTIEVLGNFDQSDRDSSREIFNRWCDTTLAREELDFSPAISVTEGIRRLAECEDIPPSWPTLFDID